MSAAAAPFPVETTVDRIDDNPGDGVCRGQGLTDPAADCTLRAAVQETNATAGPDTILLRSGTILRPVTYVLTGARGEDEAATGDLDVKGELTLTAGAARTRVILGAPIIDGNGVDRVFDVTSTGSLTLIGVIVRNGDPGVGPFGGGIRAHPDSQLVLSQVTVSGNRADGGGGGVYAGKLTATNTTFTGNRAVTVGAAIYVAGEGPVVLTRVAVRTNVASSPGPATGGMTNFGATATVTDSTFERNTGIALVNGTRRMTILNTTVTSNTAERGAAIFNLGLLTLTNSTIAGNVATTAGGGLHNTGEATLVNSTFAGNSAPMGGNVFSGSAPSTVTKAVNTVFSGATSGGNCIGPIASQGHNLEDGTTCALSGPGDLSNQNPILAPLGDNGGPTLTQALIAGSPAIDAGDRAVCPATDQRGVTRPTGTGCDIGAYEFAISADLAVTLAAAPAQVKVGEQVTFTATVTNKGPNPATGVTLTNALPAGATFISATPSAGSCTTGAAVVCTLGGLADQATATVRIIVAASTAGTLRDNASVRALQVDPDSTTNTASAEATVVAPQTAVGGATGFSAKVVSLRARRINGRARISVVLLLSKPVTARATLLRRGRAVAASSKTLRSGRRVLVLASRRRTRAGRYVLRVVLVDAQRNRSVLTLRVVLR